MVSPSAFGGSSATHFCCRSRGPGRRTSRVALDKVDLELYDGEAEANMKNAKGRVSAHQVTLPLRRCFESRIRSRTRVFAPPRPRSETARQSRCHIRKYATRAIEGDFSRLGGPERLPSSNCGRSRSHGNTSDAERQLAIWRDAHSGYIFVTHDPHTASFASEQLHLEKGVLTELPAMASQHVSF